MAEDNKETDRIVRTSPESLIINVTNDELKYRNKYLPDPRRLADEKIVCTVCSVSLAYRVRKGKAIYVHTILGVLVCKACYNFYGDGIFSTDEDGEDKYCRWCGQGGTLYLCSRCNCGFCKKCMTKNMKNSALAEIDKDDWKCLVCVPRPIFGSRAVCWASQELNNTTRKSELLKLRLEEEKLRLTAENEKAEQEIEEQSVKWESKRSDGISKKRAFESEESDSSSVFIPTKKLKDDPKVKKSLNGSVKKHRRKNENLSACSDLSDNEHGSKWQKRKQKPNKCKSSSSEESSSNLNRKKKKRFKKRDKTSSNESSDTDEMIPKSKAKKSDRKSHKVKRKRILSKRKGKKSTCDSSSNETSGEVRKKKHKKGKEKSLDEMSSDDDVIKTENEMKKEIIPKKDNIGDSTDVKETSTPIDIDEIISDEQKLESIVSVKPKQTENESENLISGERENLPFEKLEIEEGKEVLSTEKTECTERQILMKDIATLEDIEKQGITEESSQQISLLNEDEFTLSYHGSSSKTDEKLSISQEDEVNVKVHLAIEWLESVSNDIADLGSLITARTNKFGEKKINLENLDSYEDVLVISGKLKQLLGGIHTNFSQIENTLEDKLESWKILTGLEKSDLEEQLFDLEEVEIHDNGDVQASDDIQFTDKIQDDDQIHSDCNILDVDGSELIQGENILTSHSELNKDESDFSCIVNSSVLTEAGTLNTEHEVALTNDCKENIAQVSKDKDAKEVQEGLEKINIPEEVENELIPSQNDETILKDVTASDSAVDEKLESHDINSCIIKAELNLKSGSSHIWSGLLSSDNDSELSDDSQKRDSSNGNEKSADSVARNHMLDSETDNETSVDNKVESKNVDEKDTANFEALQELLYSSSEPDIGSSGSASEDSSDIQLDDSDLENILKPRKVISKKSKKKETKVKGESNENFKVEVKEEKEDEDQKTQKDIEVEKKIEEPLDSEAEIDMLTDLTKLKKKTVLRRVEQQESSYESSSESKEDDSNEGQSEKKKRKKYNTEVKKKREQERNELLGFLQGDSSAEDEVDITKDDLDVMEDQYVSESSDSMTMEAFSRKMNKKWHELEKEQDELNLQMLLASESDEGSVGGDDLVLDAEEEKKKKKEKKVKDEKVNEDEAVDAKDETEVKVEKEEEGDEKGDENEPVEPDEEYEQFVKDLAKTRTTFTGIGSSSEEEKEKGKEEIEIKEEPLSDHNSKVKKEPKCSEDEDSSFSNSSSDLFLDKSRKKSEKKPAWRHHKLLRMKLSDTDTSDEERWWQRRLEREKKKKEQGDSSKKSPRSPKKKEENGSDKENKKIRKVKEKVDEDEEANSSSTLEISSTESSGSEIFKKKKKKKKDSSDSDVVILSDTDKKKKKKRKKLSLSGDESEESEESDDDVIDITQKSSQGESPGKGGRKNIRKVLTKHELAAATKAAAKEEEERKKRIAARQKLFNEMFEIKEAEILEKLVLDFDPETKTELISVDKDLVIKMKPHQAKGVKFMWDSCFESLSQLKTKKGSGCILAHCMGLGKTFQVVSLVHTILTHKDTNVRTVLVVCPLSTVLNWYNEFDKWLEDVARGRDIKIYHLTKFKKAHERSKQLSLWHRTGGVMILGYEMFRILANNSSKKFRLMHMEVFQKTLIDPGADLVVCDEGHMLKNESTALSKAMSRIRTLRRIVLTGTPMQNNLKEYHCMVQFVKPNLLGTRKEFLNQFVNPITNGQFVDSTEADVKVMKRRAHVLHKMLEGLVQRFDYSVLMPFLPPKHEYVISLRLTDVQVKLYQFYLDYFCQKKSDDKRTSSQLFQDWQVLGRIWTHPRVVKMSTDKAEKEKQKQESEDEGSIKDFINDKSSSSSLSLSSSNSSSDDENGEKKEKVKKKKKQKDEKEPKKEETSAPEVPVVEAVDEINLISSEEEDGDIKEVKVDVKIDSDNEDKINDSGIEDQDGKTGNEPNTAEETVNTDTNNKGEEESKEEEESESKEETLESKEETPENKEETPESKEEKPESKEEKSEKQKKKGEGEQLERRGAWWKDIVDPEHLEDIKQSAKLVVLFAILRECELIEDKVLVFSQSLFSLDLIEYFLEKVDKATGENRLDENLGNNAGCWQKGLDYFRLDGSSSSENRSAWCKSFNRDDNPRARLFLISTRAGGLGINLTGANRVVIFDASWNPSHDVQSIFRVFRFGQKKPCYVYRFIVHGTMEEKVYDRQVAKQSLSSRVVDEQQVHRHFSMNDLNELYNFTPPAERTEKPTPVLPKDRLMAELLTQYNDWIEKYHEHDSLLENIAEEELNEEERQLAWEDYENEKKRGFPPPAFGPSGVPVPGVANQLELFRKSLRLKFPNATDTEMNAMLQTLMYQVNYNRSMPQQIGGQQQGHQVGAGISQQQQNFRTMNSNNMTSAQRMFNAQRNHLYQKYGTQTIQHQRMGNNQMNQQRIGNGQINQQRVQAQMNQQRVGNGQIRQKTRQEIYMEQMRTQQEANLNRIQNQRRYQQQQSNPTQQPVQQVNVTGRRRQQPQVRDTLFNTNRQQQQTTQNQGQQLQNIWKSNQSLGVNSNRLHQIQKNQQSPMNILSTRKQLQITPVKNSVKPVTTNTQQLASRTPQQKMQEQMRQRISELQRKKSQQTLQQNLQQTTQKSSSLGVAQQRRLEEMKKRYNASRSKQIIVGSSQPISIVEIDDEPGT